MPGTVELSYDPIQTTITRDVPDFNSVLMRDE